MLVICISILIFVELHSEQTCQPLSNSLLYPQATAKLDNQWPSLLLVLRADIISSHLISSCMGHDKNPFLFSYTRTHVFVHYGNTMRPLRIKLADIFMNNCILFTAEMKFWKLKKGYNIQNRLSYLLSQQKFRSKHLVLFHKNDEHM